MVFATIALRCLEWFETRVCQCWKEAVSKTEEKRLAAAMIRQGRRPEESKPAAADVEGGPRVATARLCWVDIARTGALAGMIVFHFVRDLEMFAIISSGTTLGGGWAVFARLIAGTFLFLSGVSFALTHRENLRFRKWMSRLVVVSGAAALVSLASFLAMPDRWIYFGILHTIAAASVIGLGFVRAPAIVSALGALSVWWAAAEFGRSLALPIWLVWTGLGSSYPPTLDYLPLLPWIAPFLAGLAFAKIIPPERLEPRWTSPPKALAWPGQHSLAVYLCHQPVLIALIGAIAWLAR